MHKSASVLKISQAEKIRTLWIMSALLLTFFLQYFFVTVSTKTNKHLQLNYFR